MCDSEGWMGSGQAGHKDVIEAKTERDINLH